MIRVRETRVKGQGSIRDRKIKAQAAPSRLKQPGLERESNAMYFSLGYHLDLPHSAHHIATRSCSAAERFARHLALNLKTKSPDDSALRPKTWRHLALTILFHSTSKMVSSCVNNPRKSSILHAKTPHRTIRGDARGSDIRQTREIDK